MVAELRSNRLREGSLEEKRALHLILGLILVGLASSIIAAITLALLVRLGLAAVSIAAASFIALLANLDTKEPVVGHGGLDDLGNHAVNTEADVALSLQLTKRVLGGVKLVVKLSKLIRNEVLRDSSHVTRHVHSTTEGRLHLSVLHETKEGVSLEAEITILARNGGRVLLGIVVGILKDGTKVSVETVVVEGTDPAMRPARSNVSLELVIPEASIRRGGGRSRSGNIDVVRELLLVEHGARVAGRHEEDELLEHPLGGPSLEASGKIIIVEELLSGHSNDTRATVIIVEDEDVIVLGGLESLARTSTSGIARKNVDKVLDGSITSDVILHDTLINIDVGTTLDIEFVENLTGEGILTVVSDIILEEGDDLAIRNTSLVSKLVGLAHGGLVTIVAPASATGDKNDPGLATLGLTALNSFTEHLVLLVCKNESNESHSHKDCLHHF